MYGEVVIKNRATKTFLIIVSISFCWAHEKGESHYVYLQNPSDSIKSDWKNAGLMLQLQL